MVKILGVSSSLRNARFGVESINELIRSIKSLPDDQALAEFLEKATKARIEDYMDAGKREDLSFDKIYRNIARRKRDRGLSNSDAVLVAGLWGAHTRGADIEYCSLAKFFPYRGKPLHLTELRDLVLGSDGILLAGPVYFGDRGSLAQDFIDFLRNDPQCRAHIRGRPYAGITVGAKRNGGQETTLIYQMIDMVNLGMLVVGNDSATTAQYGGTANAGDVGTLSKDSYGIWTSTGTGRRLANVCRLLEIGHALGKSERVRISIWLVQDSTDHRGLATIERLRRELLADTDAEVIIHDFTDQTIDRCIACDICPTSLSRAVDYGCIIKSPDDLFVNKHSEIIDTDAILIAAYSPVDRSKVKSVYQRFIERTRYIRHNDYALSDRLSAPLIISEIDAQQNLHIRMLTSLLRHHQVMHHPLIGREFGNELLNWDSLLRHGRDFIANAKRIRAGRIALERERLSETVYNPVGFDIGTAKLNQDHLDGTIAKVIEMRQADAEIAKKRRG